MSQHHPLLELPVEWVKRTICILALYYIGLRVSVTNLGSNERKYFLTMLVSESEVREILYKQNRKLGQLVLPNGLKKTVVVTFLLSAGKANRIQLLAQRSITTFEIFYNAFI